MTIEEKVLEKRRWPAPPKTDVVDSLEEKDAEKKPLRGLRGLWKDLNIRVTDAKRRTGAKRRATPTPGPQGLVRLPSGQSRLKRGSFRSR
jgi:hypothetical protein